MAHVKTFLAVGWFYHCVLSAVWFCKSKQGIHTGADHLQRQTETLQPAHQIIYTVYTEVIIWKKLYWDLINIMQTHLHAHQTTLTYNSAFSVIIEIRGNVTHNAQDMTSHCNWNDWWPGNNSRKTITPNINLDHKFRSKTQYRKEKTNRELKDDVKSMRLYECATHIH